MEWSRISNETVEWFAVHMEVSDVATTKSKASQNFHDVSFGLRWFEILQVLNPFCNWLYSFWWKNVSQKIRVFEEEERFLWSGF